MLLFSLPWTVFSSLVYALLYYMLHVHVQEINIFLFSKPRKFLFYLFVFQLTMFLKQKRRKIFIEDNISRIPSLKQAFEKLPKNNNNKKKSKSVVSSALCYIIKINNNLNWLKYICYYYKSPAHLQQQKPRQIQRGHFWSFCWEKTKTVELGLVHLTSLPVGLRPNRN